VEATCRPGRPAHHILGEMSRAFVKNEEDRAAEELPDRAISPHPNLVTAQGLVLIEAEIARLEHEQAAAITAQDRSAIARTSRDLRYWTARRASAEVIPPPTGTTEVRFGSVVTIVCKDSRMQTFRIVGEDEANPGQGTLSHVSPLAQALFGKEVGDVIKVGHAEAEVVNIE
jgi:transcription elongation GreA/GreB family factor